MAGCDYHRFITSTGKKLEAMQQFRHTLNPSLVEQTQAIASHLAACSLPAGLSKRINLERNERAAGHRR